MARTRIDLNNAGVRELLNSPGVAAEMRRRAERVAAAARASAPVDTGAYRDSIHVQSGTTDRAVAAVVASVSYSHAVEAKTGTLARALDAAG